MRATGCTAQNSVFFFTIMAVLALLGLWLVSGYLAVIVFSLVMVIIVILVLVIIRLI